MIQPEETRLLEFDGMEVVAFRTRTLGNWSYLLSSDGDAVAIDPQRDAQRYLESASGKRLRLMHVVETHIHSDYLSGGLWLSQQTGAGVVAPARGQYEFRHTPVDDGDELNVGGMTLRCMATPGHTSEHVSWQLLEAGSDTPVAVLTGGSLLAGGAGRTDLSGDEATDELTRRQYASIRKIAELADTALVLPTHGGGSTCSVAVDEGVKFATVAEERIGNPYLAPQGVEQFTSALLDEVAPAPAYFPHVAAMNREGPPAEASSGPVAELSPARFAQIVSAGAWVVDARNRYEFADAHIPGSLNLEPSDLFTTQVGSLVPFGTQIALIVDQHDGGVVGDLANECFRIGYSVAGVLGGGIGGWSEAGLELQSYPASDILELFEEASRGHVPQIIDVRDPVEWREGTLPGSATVSISGLAEHASELRQLWANPSDGRLNVACTGGARAAVAASYLAKYGIPVRVVLGGGIPDALGFPAMARTD